jgi:hypothetical protein
MSLIRKARTRFTYELFFVAGCQGQVKGGFVLVEWDSLWYCPPPFSFLIQSVRASIPKILRAYPKIPIIGVFNTINAVF